jgi:hypothetical protein
MTDEEKTVKIQEIQANFILQLRGIEKARDAKISAIKKGVDERRISEILKDIKG